VAYLSRCVKAWSRFSPFVGYVGPDAILSHTPSLQAPLDSAFWRTMPIPLRLRFMLLTSLHWTAAWAAIGLLFGIAMTLGRVPPIAEPGAPSGYAFYVFWIPICLGAGSVLGLLLGVLYSGLVAAIDLWRPSDATEQHSFMITYGWRMVCGASAGGAIGWPLMKDWNALWLVGMGIASALVSGYLNRSKPLILDP
jgi:hypothetical protein